MVGGQLGVERPVDRQCADRTETQPLYPCLQVEHDGTLDVCAVLQTGHRGDGKGDRLRSRRHGVCQLLRLPPTTTLPAGILIS